MLLLHTMLGLQIDNWGAFLSPLRICSQALLHIENGLKEKNIVKHHIVRKLMQYVMIPVHQFTNTKDHLSNNHF